MCEITPGLPSLSRSPAPSPNRLSMSAVEAPFSRIRIASRRRRMSTKRRPRASADPRSSISTSACRCSRPRASNVESIGLLANADFGGDRGLVASNSPSGGSPREAIEEGENVGFGWTTPICWRRWEKLSEWISASTGRPEGCPREERSGSRCQCQCSWALGDCLSHCLARWAPVGLAWTWLRGGSVCQRVCASSDICGPGLAPLSTPRSP